MNREIPEIRERSGALAAKGIIGALLVLGISAVVADAREINAQSFRELDKMCDTIVVAKPVSTRDTDERTDLQGITPAVPVIGLSSEFDVDFVVKGDTSLKKVTVHHYRLAKTDQLLISGPMLASFDPNAKKRYLLFLKREADGRYAPFEQVDPAVTSFLELSGPGWDKMGVEDFRKWLDARKWRAARVPFEEPLSPELSPEIWPASWGESAVFEQTAIGDVENLRKLLEADPGLVAKRASYAQQTPLHGAAEMGWTAVAELLLSHNADIEARAYGGWTPLLNAVFGGHKDMVELLLKNKAKVNFQEEAGRSPLHVAAENGYTEIAAVLLADGAEVNVSNREGMTPLHVAAALGHKDLVELLLDHKANVNAKDNNGRTPLAFAELHKNQEMAELLKKHGGVK